MKKFFKSLYNLVPFKREIFSVIRTVVKPSESVYRHLHFKGVFKVPLAGSLSFKINHYGFVIENEIFWKGLVNGWEKESIGLWIKLCKEAETILDIGANTGIYSLVAQTINPKAKVFAFEPVKRVFTRLQENIALNNFDITAIEKAVSDRDGTAMIYDTNAEHTLSVTVNKNMLEGSADVIETQIETISLNSFIKQNKLTGIDLMKIDVETHEPEVLEGFSDYLVQYKPTMLIEILNDDIGQKVDKIVEGMGYLFFNIDEKGGIRQVERIVKSDYYNYLLCVPSVAHKLGLKVTNATVI
jgi:FkbM family methyltransferase